MSGPSEAHWLPLEAHREDSLEVVNRRDWLALGLRTAWMLPEQTMFQLQVLLVHPTESALVTWPRLGRAALAQQQEGKAQSPRNLLAAWLRRCLLIERTHQILLRKVVLSCL